jgi:hypothetical protein
MICLNESASVRLFPQNRVQTAVQQFAFWAPSMAYHMDNHCQSRITQSSESISDWLASQPTCVPIVPWKTKAFLPLV